MQCVVTCYFLVPFERSCNDPDEISKKLLPLGGADVCPNSSANWKTNHFIVIETSNPFCRALVLFRRLVCCLCCWDLLGEVCSLVRCRGAPCFNKAVVKYALVTPRSRGRAGVGTDSFPGMYLKLGTPNITKPFCRDWVVRWGLAITKRCVIFSSFHFTSLHVTLCYL